MKKSNIAFFTVVFPANINYLHDFFNTLKNQTIKNFDIIIVNDGIDSFNEFLIAYAEFNIVELKYSDTPSKNREFGINYIINNKYEIIIFGDSDDYFETNRVEVCIDKLNNYDIVVNDITLFDNSNLFEKKYFSNRLENNSEIELNFIREKNIFGLSNTAIKINLLKNISIPDNLIAVDWYLFSILLLYKYKAVFTNETISYYRQYENNIVGIKKPSKESILQGLSTKIKHYESLLDNDTVYNNMYKEMMTLKTKIQNEQYLELFKKHKINNPLWWEEIKLI